jgi:hypothetical protein
MRAVSLLGPGRAEPQQQPPLPPQHAHSDETNAYDYDYDEEYYEEYEEEDDPDPEGHHYNRSLDPQLDDASVAECCTALHCTQSSTRSSKSAGVTALH